MQYKVAPKRFFILFLLITPFWGAIITALPLLLGATFQGNMFAFGQGLTGVIFLFFLAYSVTYFPIPVLVIPIFATAFFTYSIAQKVTERREICYFSFANIAAACGVISWLILLFIFDGLHRPTLFTSMLPAAAIAAFISAYIAVRLSLSSDKRDSSLFETGEALHLSPHTIKKTASQIIILIIIAATSYKAPYLFFQKPNEDQVIATTITDRIQIKNSGKNGFPAYTPKYSCTGFSVVNYQGENYYYMGSGAILSTSKTHEEFRYLVNEQWSEHNSNRWQHKVNLTLEDSLTGKKLGHRQLWRAERTWEDHIGRGRKDTSMRTHDFVQQVLGGYQNCVSTHPATAFGQESEEISIDISKADLRTKVSGCEKKNVTYSSFQTILTPSWTYRFGPPINKVLCSGNNIFIFNFSSLSYVKVDWLDQQGILKGQFLFDIKHRDSYRHQIVNDVAVLDDAIQINITQVPRIGGESYSGKARKWRIDIDLARSQRRNPWCDGVGEVSDINNIEGSCQEMEAPNPMIGVNPKLAEKE